MCTSAAMPTTSALAVPVVRLSDPPVQAAAALRRACIDSGFLLLTDHGVPPAVIQAQRQASRAFFELPLQQKLSVLASRDPNNRGYSPVNEQWLDPTAEPDSKEGYYIGCEVETAADNLPLCGPNQWPPENTVPGFRTAVMAYHAAMLDLSNHLLRLLELALELPVGWFNDKFDHSIATLRPLHYPAQERSSATGQLGAGAHTDFGIWTLLLTDEQQGLQIMYRGEWVDVPPRPDCLVFNIGDLLERWTNGLFKSTLHRVVNTGQERYSTAFFFDANFDALVECVPTCCAPDNPPRFGPITAGQHLMSCLQRSHTEHRLKQ